MSINLYDSVSLDPHAGGNFFTRGLYSLGDSLIADAVRDAHKGKKYKIIIKNDHLECYEAACSPSTKKPHILQKIVAYIGIFLKWLATFSATIEASHKYVQNPQDPTQQDKILGAVHKTLKKDGSDSLALGCACATCAICVADLCCMV